jgi:thiosulfate/3-mercaptopyruvate sulfurtransferase
VCGTCHIDVQEAHQDSLHAALTGYDTALYERSTPDNHPTLEAAEEGHCNNCHATCGQCHVSQPTSVGGGLLDGHEFLSTPPMSRTCTACHGSRVGDEYTGGNEGYPADVHLTGERMNCADCHTGDEMHGEGIESAHRYEGARAPLCETCHEDALTADSGIEQHTIHGQEVACEVCHSVAYKNCSSCHVARTDEGIPFFETADTWMDFRIGLNPVRTAERPWQYVLVRHVPIDPESFAFYGDNLLPNFDLRPTWLYATPHNTQASTPQNEECTNCHGNSSLFLTASAVTAEERDANASVIVAQPPSINLVEEYFADHPESR